MTQEMNIACYKKPQYQAWTLNHMPYLCPHIQTQPKASSPQSLLLLLPPKK